MVRVIFFLLLVTGLNAQVTRIYLPDIGEVYAMPYEYAITLDFLARKGMKLDTTIKLYNEVIQGHKVYRETTSLMLHRNKITIDSLTSEIKKIEKNEIDNANVIYNLINDRDKYKHKSEKYIRQRNNVIWIGSSILGGMILAFMIM